MTDVSIPPYLRRKIESLGLHYDPTRDQWYLDQKQNIWLELDRSYGMFLWVVYTDSNGPICWSQTIEEFKKLKRKTFKYYIGDKIRNRINLIYGENND